MSNKAYIVLANGQVFEGKSFGATGCITGEVVFTTGMTGYLEALTDPSFYGQIILQTFPLIGNYGIIPEDAESGKTHPLGYIVREWCPHPSNFRCKGTIDDYLKENGIVGVYDVDTRALTKIIREHGVMNARIVSFCGDAEKDAKAAMELHAIMHDIVENPGFVAHAERIRLLEDLKSFKLEGEVEAVTGSAASIEQTAEEVFAESAEYKAVPVTETGLKINDMEEATKNGRGKKVVLWDFGAKANIRRELLKRGLEVVTVPANTTCEQIVELCPDGVMLSSGPGDPESNPQIISELSKLCKTGLPVFAIGLGHMLLALAFGAKSEKMKYGHRGENQPVKDVATGRVYIASQNHGYAILPESLPKGSELSFVNVNDGTCEGIKYTEFPGFSVQFHPEASGGPLDTNFIFDRFVDLINSVKQ